MSLSNHDRSSGFVDSSARVGCRNPVAALHPAIDWSSGDDDSVMLCPTECLTDRSMCLTDEERENPSRPTVMAFVLPLKIHFRYCWLYSGVPWRNTTRLGNRTAPLTKRELHHVNRTLMGHDITELCNQVCAVETADQQDMKAFWLTTEGRLVCVDRLSEDLKFRHIRQRNLRVALSLWTSNPELCGQTMRTSGSAHANLIRICGEAMSLSQGSFYNLYAKYPLPVDTTAKQDVSFEFWRVDEKDIHATEIQGGQALLVELVPLYTEYFSFIMNPSTVSKLTDRVQLLDAQWWVQEELSELEFSQNLKTNGFARMLARLAFFLATS